MSMQLSDRVKKLIKGDISSEIEKIENVKKNVRYFEGFEVDEQGYVKTSNSEKRATADGKVRAVSLEEAVCRDIPADQIEVRLFDDEIQDPEGFWSMHTITDESVEEGIRKTCKEDYLELASRIPGVYEAIKSGKTKEEILQDPELKETYLKYFADNRMIRAVEGNGYVEMQGDGRHRILAARELNMKIPVKIDSRYQNQQLQKNYVASESGSIRFADGESLHW